MGCMSFKHFIRKDLYYRVKQQMKPLLIVFLALQSLFAFESLDNTSSHIDGANCWNGAMVASKVVRGKRFFHPEEWKIHLQRNCRKIKWPRYGSVGRITTIEGLEVHAFIHVDDKTIFAKHGEDSDHGYKIMSYQDMMIAYGKKRSCKIAKSNEAHCFHKTSYYDCFQEAKIDEHLIMLGELFEKVTFSSETKYHYKMECGGNVFKARESLLLQALETLKKLASKSKLYRDRSLEKAMFLSFSEQLYNIQVSYRSFPCKGKEKRKARDANLKKVSSLLKRVLQ